MAEAGPDAHPLFRLTAAEALNVLDALLTEWQRDVGLAAPPADTAPPRSVGEPTAAPLTVAEEATARELLKGALW